MTILKTSTIVDREKNSITFTWGENNQAVLALSDREDSHAVRAVINGKEYDPGEKRKTWVEYTGWLLIGGESSGFQFYSAEELVRYEINNIPEEAREYVTASFIHALSEPDYGQSVKTNILESTVILAQKWVHVLPLVLDSLWAYDELLSGENRTDNIDPVLYRGMVDLGDGKRDDELVNRLDQRIREGRVAAESLGYLWKVRQNEKVRPTLKGLIKNPKDPWVASVLDVLNSLPEQKENVENNDATNSDLYRIVKESDDGSAIRRAVRSITSKKVAELNGKLLNIMCDRLTGESTGYGPLTALMELLGEVGTWGPLNGMDRQGTDTFLRIANVIDHAIERHRSHLSSVQVARTMLSIVKTLQDVDRSITLLNSRHRYNQSVGYSSWIWIGQQTGNSEEFDISMFDALGDTVMGFISFKPALEILEGARKSADSGNPKVRKAAIRFLLSQLINNIPIVNLYADTLMRSSDDSLIRESLDGVENIDGPLSDSDRTLHLSRIRGGPGRSMRQVLPFNENRDKAQQKLDDLEKVLLNACSDENASVAKQAFEGLRRLQEKQWNKLAEPDNNKFLPLVMLPGTGFSGAGDGEENRIMGAMFDQWQRYPDDIIETLDELHDLLLKHMDEKPEVFSYDIDTWAVTAGARIDSPAADARIFAVEVMEDIGVTDEVSIQTKAYCLSQIVNAKVWKGRRDERLSAAQSVTHILAAASDIKGMIKLIEESGVRQLADALIDTLQDVDNLGEIWSTALSALEQMISHSVIPPSRYAGIIGALDNVLTNLDEKEVSEKVVLMLRSLSERDDVPGSNKERARSRLLDAAVTSERDEQILALEAIEKTKLSSRLRRRMIDDLVVLRKTEAELVGQIDRTLLAHNYSVRKEKTKKYAITAGGVIAGAIAGQILAKINVIISLLGKLIDRLF